MSPEWVGAIGTCFRESLLRVHNFVWMQLRKSNTRQPGSTVDYHISNMWFYVIRFFVEHPEMRQYFYERLRPQQRQMMLSRD